MKTAAGRGPYFAQVPFDLLFDHRIDASAIAVYAALRSYTDFGSEHGAKPSQTGIAKRAGCSRTTVQARLRLLRDLGWIEWMETGRTHRFLVHQTCSPDEHHLLARRASDARQTSTTKSQLPRTSTENGDSEKRVTWLTPFYEVWEKAFPGSEIPSARLARAIKALQKKGHEDDEIRIRLKRYLDRTPGQYTNPQSFAQQWSDLDHDEAYSPMGLDPNFARRYGIK